MAGHKGSGILNAVNDWQRSEYHRYIVDLVKRVVQVSLETVRVLPLLPSLSKGPA